MHSQTLTYEIDATLDLGQETAIGRSKESTIEFDAGISASETLPGPADLLTLAFGACIMKNVARFAEMMPFDFERAAIHVAADREASTPPRMARIRYRLELLTDEPPRRIDLLHRNITRFGTIFNTLAAVCDIAGEITATPSTGNPQDAYQSQFTAEQVAQT